MAIKKLVEVWDGKILIEWKKPFNGRGKISNYIIMVYETFNKKNGIQVNISSNPQCEICEHEIKNLKNALIYFLKITTKISSKARMPNKITPIVLDL